MARTAWLTALVGALLLPRPVLALDGTEPRIRIGASAGVVGSLPLGPDVGQDGYPDEFEKALWVHVDALQVDIGDYVQLNASFRLTVVGGYNTDPLTRSFESDDSSVPDRLVTPPKSKSALMGVGARFFPFGAGRVRPFLSLGLGYSLAGAANAGTCPQVAIDQPDQGQGGGPMLPAQLPGDSDCPSGAVTSASRRHQGLGLSFGLGVRFDPTITAFEEPWLLPITLEVGYVKNFWLGVQRTPGAIWADSEFDPGLQQDRAAVASAKPKVDYLGLLLTVGFLR